VDKRDQDVGVGAAYPWRILRLGLEWQSDSQTESKTRFGFVFCSLMGEPSLSNSEKKEEEENRSELPAAGHDGLTDLTFYSLAPVCLISWEIGN
jgi:hypothetical protein